MIYEGQCARSANNNVEYFYLLQYGCVHWRSSCFQTDFEKFLGIKSVMGHKYSWIFLEVSRVFGFYSTSFLCRFGQSVCSFLKGPILNFAWVCVPSASLCQEVMGVICSVFVVSNKSHKLIHILSSWLLYVKFRSLILWVKLLILKVVLATCDYRLILFLAPSGYKTWDV